MRFNRRSVREAGWVPIFKLHPRRHLHDGHDDLRAKNVFPALQFILCGPSAIILPPDPTLSAFHATIVKSLLTKLVVLRHNSACKALTSQGLQAAVR